MMKSKTTIIAEVVALVKKQGRAVINGECVYRTKDGKVCGHSMACKEETVSMIMSQDFSYSATAVIDEFGDEAHKEEYQGHDIHFWESIQNLHDKPKHWEANGLLSKKGKRVVRKMLKEAA